MAATVAGARAASGRRLGAFLATLLVAGSAAAAPDEIEIVASKDGFRPKLVKVHKGEITRLKLRSADGEHCFAIDALRIEKRVRSGQPTRLDLTPDRAGTFAFYCCLETGKQAESERGEIVVSE